MTLEGSLGEKNVKLFCIRRDHDIFQTTIADITDTSQVISCLNGTIESLSRTAEAYDEETGNHLKRINR